MSKKMMSLELFDPIKVMSAIGAVLLLVSACTPVVINTPGVTETIPPTAGGTELQPTEASINPSPTPEYRTGSGGKISQEDLDRMRSEDPSLGGKLDWLTTWFQWYQNADPSIRPFPPGRSQEIVVYSWNDENGGVHYQPAWKFDNNYPGMVILPPVINWENLNPPMAAPNGHEIAPGQGPIMVSTEVEVGSELAKIGIPVGSVLGVENGSGDWVMIFNDKIQARIDDKGAWQRVLDLHTGIPATTAECDVVNFSDPIQLAERQRIDLAEAGKRSLTEIIRYFDVISSPSLPYRIIKWAYPNKVDTINVLKSAHIPLD